MSVNNDFDIVTIRKWSFRHDDILKVFYTMYTVHYLHISSSLTGADVAYFQGGVWPIVHEPRSGEPIFCFVFFYEPRSGEPIFLWLFYEPRSGEPIFVASLRAAKRRADFFAYFTSREAASRFFLWLFWTPVSDVFLASTNAMETMITSLAAQGGGGG